MDAVNKNARGQTLLTALLSQPAFVETASYGDLLAVTSANRSLHREAQEPALWRRKFASFLPVPAASLAPSPSRRAALEATRKLAEARQATGDALAEGAAEASEWAPSRAEQHAEARYFRLLCAGVNQLHHGGWESPSSSCASTLLNFFEDATERSELADFGRVAEDMHMLCTRFLPQAEADQRIYKKAAMCSAMLLCIVPSALAISWAGRFNFLSTALYLGSHALGSFRIVMDYRQVSVLDEIRANSAPFRQEFAELLAQPGGLNLPTIQRFMRASRNPAIQAARWDT